MKVFFIIWFCKFTPQIASSHHYLDFHTAVTSARPPGPAVEKGNSNREIESTIVTPKHRTNVEDRAFSIPAALSQGQLQGLRKKTKPFAESGGSFSSKKMRNSWDQRTWGSHLKIMQSLCPLMDKKSSKKLG